MPVTYRIDKTLRVVFATLRGVVTAEEIGAANRGLLQDQDFEASFRQLADHRDATKLDLTTEDIRRLAAVSPFAPDSHRAFVVGDVPEHFGMARQFELWQNDGRTVRVFRDMAEARAWLGLDSEEVEPL